LITHPNNSANGPLFRPSSPGIDCVNRLPQLPTRAAKARELSPVLLLQFVEPGDSSSLSRNAVPRIRFLPPNPADRSSQFPAIIRGIWLAHTCRMKPRETHQKHSFPANAYTDGVLGCPSTANRNAQSPLLTRRRNTDCEKKNTWRPKFQIPSSSTVSFRPVVARERAKTSRTNHRTQQPPIAMPSRKSERFATNHFTPIGQ